jgi:HTH-type transcriptional regulator, glycine betaine synthesis regulator
MPRLPKTNPPVSTAQLTAAQEQFVQAWGQMGPAWGISRTMAEAHALLYITGTPLNTDDVMDKLRISRGNASMSIRALLEWGLISRIHLRGDRKEYFQADADPWSMARVIIRERLRREILPLLASLYDIRDQTGERSDAAAPRPVKTDAEPASPEAIKLHNDRLDAMVSLVQTVDRLGERFVGSEGKGLKLAATLLSKVI